MDSEDRKTFDLKGARTRIGNSLGFRAGLLFLMGLLLMIPLSMIEDLLYERQQRKFEAVQNIAASWGGEQAFAGPILAVPIVFETEQVKKRIINGLETFERSLKKREETLFFLPEELDLKGELDPMVRYRGIFKSTVYHGDLKASSRWSKPDLVELGYKNASVDWKQAVVAYKLTEPRRVLSVSMATGDGQQLSVEPVRMSSYNEEWIGAPVSWDGRDDLSLEASIEFKGSESFAVSPFANRSVIELKSTWGNPSFEGRSIPLDRSISESGFVANWKFSAFGRGLPQHWLGSSNVLSPATINQNASGVALIDPVDSYRLAERSLKYGALFVALGFLVFFLFEALLGVRLHGMQYLLAGVGQVLFFLIVLALSEVVAFSWAYSIGAIASASLVSFYALSVLGSFRRSMEVVGVLGGLYGVLFVILKEQDYALLAGAGLLFFSLGLVMFLTRKLDWGNRTQRIST